MKNDNFVSIFDDHLVWLEAILNADGDLEKIHADHSIIFFSEVTMACDEIPDNLVWKIFNESVKFARKLYNGQITVSVGPGHEFKFYVYGTIQIWPINFFPELADKLVK